MLMFWRHFKGNSTDLDQFVPTAADNHRVLRVWAKSNARNPLGVSLLGNSELAVAEGVPQLDAAIS